MIESKVHLKVMTKKNSTPLLCTINKNVYCNYYVLLMLLAYYTGIT